LKTRILHVLHGLTPILVAVATCLALATVPRAADAPFFFIQLTDPQFGMAASNADFAQETANFEFAISTANRLRPAFVVVTGDLVNRAGDEAQVAEYLRIASKLDRAIPLYNLPGNHDIADPPTPESVAAYTKRFGPDHFTFRHGAFVGIVIDTPIIVAPQRVSELAATQETWLRAELGRARRDGIRHIVVFQHHPLFFHDAAEPDDYFNVPHEPRARLLALYREFGVRYIFAGHYHRNATALSGDLEMVTTGPVGKPLGDGKSGLRIVTVSDTGIEHRFYEFGEIPNEVIVR
jgi:3',5'-cyclic AMP phosphodiesterase CpdA